MAAYNLNRTLHKTLSGTTVDVITLTGDVSYVEVLERSGGTLTVTDNNTTPVALADDTELVQANEAVIIDSPRSRVIQILGNGNSYSLKAGL